MRFSLAIIASALAVFVAAENNPFTMATIPATIPAGSAYNITWKPTTAGTVSLVLVQAVSSGSTNVKPVATIACMSPLPHSIPPMPFTSLLEFPNRRHKTDRLKQQT
jgi:hypothetical protein